MGIFSNGKCISAANLFSKTAVVTGANSGIGYETAKDFVKRGAKVIMANRNVELSERAAEKLRQEVPNCNVRVVQLNLASLHSVKKCAEELLRSEPKINLLINNAGVMMCPYMTTEDGYEMQFQTNHLGHFLFTTLLLPRIKESAPARIINVSSTAHLFGKINFNDLQSEKSYNPTKAYGQSKLCNILFTSELTEVLKGTRVVAYAVHPGVVSTELGRHLRGSDQLRLLSKISKMIWTKKTPLEGAQTTLHCALDERLATQSGLYFSDCQPGMMSRRATNKGDAKKLWEVSERLIKEALD
ncbi:retinol dehydrogenase 12-like [Neocloeon triangulifer]|uniref:retinol dehydrogenase 12-like n=1 Tax=Neocloeon triangulifer TaxID=2078957 RepID=UPI00286F4BF7|nr:retinol dehydrogenase 12-like [Neocloeon triangulifer]XP_059473309.1 retinol dehydrogenase 12-like [Neocloeon triangulifer]XP_059473311.1 retinol dehydrogenase 12-like [Neocloeon triangulifer]XP_059473312.1 retinol dehydrogenase 12-like [Neocloeon triangulifer]